MVGSRRRLGGGGGVKESLNLKLNDDFFKVFFFFSKSGPGLQATTIYLYTSIYQEVGYCPCAFSEPV